MLTILYEELKEWSHNRDTGEANDSVWVELREWKSDDGEHNDCILEHSVFVDYEQVLSGSRIIPHYLPRSKMIRAAIATFDDLVANHPALNRKEAE